MSANNRSTGRDTRSLKNRLGNQPERRKTWIQHKSGETPFWRVPAQNKGRKRPVGLVGTIIHATKGGKAKGALGKVTSQNISWHFTISRSGSVFQHVPLSRTAAHAGKKGRLEIDGEKVGRLNARTLGIELANWGPLVQFTVKGKKGPQTKYHPFNYKKNVIRRDLKPRVNGVQQHGTGIVKKKNGASKEVLLYWEEFPKLQMTALKNLLSELARLGWHDALSNVTGHSGVHPVKMDPGPAFDWDDINAHVATLRNQNRGQ